MKNWFIGGGAVALVGLIALFIATAPSDEELIRQAIAESTEASREGRPGGVLEYIDTSFLFNKDPVYDRNEVSKVVRLAKPEVEFGQFEPEIEGDEASVVADVHVKMSYLTFNIDETFPSVEVKLVKTTGVRWLVFPGSKWKIREVTAPQVSQFARGAF